MRSASVFSSRDPGYAKKSSSARTSASAASTAARPPRGLPLRAPAAHVCAFALSSRQRSMRADEVVKKLSRFAVVVEDAMVCTLVLRAQKPSSAHVWEAGLYGGSAALGVVVRRCRRRIAPAGRRLGLMDE